MPAPSRRDSDYSLVCPTMVCSRYSARSSHASLFFFFNDTATTEIYTLSLHDALPISRGGASSVRARAACDPPAGRARPAAPARSEEHTSELQSRLHLVCRLLLEKKKTAMMTTAMWAGASILTASLMVSTGRALVTRAG